MKYAIPSCQPLGNESVYEEISAHAKLARGLR